MNPTSSVRVAFEELRSIEFGDILLNYAIVGTPFANPVRTIIIHNTTDQNIIISYDVSTPKLDRSFIAAGTSRVIDYGSNMAEQAGFLEQPANEAVYVKGETDVPTSGNVYVEVIYASEN